MPPSLTFTVITSIFNTAVLLAAYVLFRLRRLPWIPSPRQTLLPHLSPSQAAALSYPPDLLPGARDVQTPHGMMRVYEWGPEDGGKVLLIHGDSTPSPMLAPIADGLAKRGCRVMLFDLYGRGYSDTPLKAPHNTRLFSDQILFAARSSPLIWTDESSGGFSIIGFSLGGAIAMSFTARFPAMVNSVVLLAPGGILRQIPDDYKAFAFRYSEWIPRAYVRRHLANLLGVDVSPKAAITNSSHQSPDSDDLGPEVPNVRKEICREVLDMPKIVQWQFDNHQGFVHSFVDTIKNNPFMNQHMDWRQAFHAIQAKESDTARAKPEGVSKSRKSRVFVIFGDEDGIVRADEVSEDIKSLVERVDSIVFKTVPGGHDFPFPRCDEVLEHISDFWSL